MTRFILDRLFTSAGHPALVLLDYIGNLSLFSMDVCRSVAPPQFFRKVIAYQSCT